MHAHVGKEQATTHVLHSSRLKQHYMAVLQHADTPDFTCHGASPTIVWRYWCVLNPHLAGQTGPWPDAQHTSRWLRHRPCQRLTACWGPTRPWCPRIPSRIGARRPKIRNLRTVSARVAAPLHTAKRSIFRLGFSVVFLAHPTHSAAGLGTGSHTIMGPSCQLQPSPEHAPRPILQFGNSNAYVPLWL